MRVFYPIKAGQLLLTVVCLALMLNSKLLCVYKDPLDELSEQQTECHATLIQKAFSPLTNKTKGLKETTTLNKTELIGETMNTTDMMDKAIRRFGALIQTAFSSVTNGTTEETSGEISTNRTSLDGTRPNSAEETSGLEKKITLNGTELAEETLLSRTETKFHLRACISIESRDVYDPKSQLTPLYSLRVFCLLILELFLLVLLVARVMTSYEAPDQLTILLNNVVHGLCWLTTAVVLFLHRCAWQTEWSSLTPAFVPIYPVEYEWAQVIAWSSLAFLLVEALLLHNCIYYDLTMEKMEEQLVQPTVIVAAYKDSDKLLLHHDHN